MNYHGQLAGANLTQEKVGTQIPKLRIISPVPSVSPDFHVCHILSFDDHTAIWHYNNSTHVEGGFYGVGSLWYGMVWYGILEFNVPLDTV